MDEAFRTKRPMKKIDLGRDDLVLDGFGATSPINFYSNKQNRGNMQISYPYLNMID